MTALSREVARSTAEARHPRDTTEPGTVDRYTSEDGHEVQAGIFGQDLTGRRFDRIVVCQQKKLSPVYSQYLCWHLIPGGRFERHGD